MTRIDSEIDYLKPKLDVKDKKILDILSENSKIPITQLAKKVEISRDVANYKLKRLETLGIIEKFTLRVDFRKLGYNTYHVFLMIDESKGEEELLEKLKKMDEVLFIFEYSDKWDIEVVLLAKNVRELDKIVSKLQAEFKETIMEREELLEINTYQSLVFSYYFNKDLSRLKFSLNEGDNYGTSDVDSYDLKIIKLLSENSRSSTYDLAKKIPLSADAIGLRIKKMVQDRVIKKFTILANFSVLGCSWYTFCIKMRAFDENTENRFRQFIEHHPGIMRAAKTFGEYDVLMYIMVENTKEFHKLIKEIKSNFSDIVKNYATYVAYKEHYFCSIPEVLLKK